MQRHELTSRLALRPKAKRRRLAEILVNERGRHTLEDLVWRTGLEADSVKVIINRFRGCLDGTDWWIPRSPKGLGWQLAHKDDVIPPHATLTERRVLRLHKMGMGRRNIGECLEMSPDTVDVHLFHLRSKGLAPPPRRRPEMRVA